VYYWVFEYLKFANLDSVVLCILKPQSLYSSYEYIFIISYELIFITKILNEIMEVDKNAK